MKKLFVYILLFVLTIGNVHSQETNSCGITNTSFKAGEKLRYSAYFRWGILQLSSFSIQSEVKRERYKGESVFAITTTGVTAGNMDKFFTIRDTLHAKLKVNDLQPLYFKEIANEEKFKATREFKYDYTDSTRVSWQFADNKNKEKAGNTTLTNCAYDAVSIIYRLRNYDFNAETLKPNQTFRIDYFSDGKSSPLQMRFEKKEIVTLKNGDRYDCLKFELEVAEGTLFKNNERVFIWITNDKNRLIAYVEAKLKIGYVKMDLVNVEHHRHPLAAKLKPVR